MGTKQVICRVKCFWKINFCVNQFLGQFLDFQHALEDQSSFDLVHVTFYLANTIQALHEKKSNKWWEIMCPLTPPPLFDNEDEDKGTRTPFMDDIHCRDQSNHPRSTLKHRQEQRDITL